MKSISSRIALRAPGMTRQRSQAPWASVISDRAFPPTIAHSAEGFPMFTDLKDRRILITGSSTGIGATLARSFAALGAVVAVHYRQSGSQAQELVENLKNEGGR